MPNQEDRQRIYLACRPIFSGENAQLRKGTKMKQLIRARKHSSLAPIFQIKKEKTIFKIVQGLLQRRVFESDLIAEVEFPDLFHPSPPGDALRQASELEASQSVSKALDEAASQGCDSGDEAPQCGDGPGPEQGGVKDEREAEPGAASGSGALVEEKGQPNEPNKGDEAIGIEPDAALGSSLSGDEKGQQSVRGKGGEAVETGLNRMPPSKPSLPPVGKVPSLYPCYLPYQAQHYILTTAQQALEECCFEFATRNMPSVLESKGWDCPAAGELTEWLEMFQKKGAAARVRPFLASIDAKELGGLFADLVRLRHSAVHRRPVTAMDISQLLGSAVRLAQALQDHRRAAQLSGVREELEGRIGAMELHKALLEDTVTAGLLDIQRQREELDRREKALIEETVSDDRQNNAFVGKLMEEHVLATFGKGKRVWAPHGIVEEQGVDYRAERERIEQSLRADHDHGVNGVPEGTGGDKDDFYDSLEEITPGTCLDEAD